jgi:hypothetical protein
MSSANAAPYSPWAASLQPKADFAQRYCSAGNLKRERRTLCAAFALSRDRQIAAKKFRSSARETSIAFSAYRFVSETCDAPLVLETFSAVVPFERYLDMIGPPGTAMSGVRQVARPPLRPREHQQQHSFASGEIQEEMLRQIHEKSSNE